MTSCSAPDVALPGRPWCVLPPAQSVAEEVIAALDVDVEAIGGRREIVMPTLDKVRAILSATPEQDEPTQHSLRTIGRSEF